MTESISLKKINNRHMLKKDLYLFLFRNSEFFFSEIVWMCLCEFFWDHFGDLTHHMRRDSWLQHLNILERIDRLLIEWHSGRYILTNHWDIRHHISSARTFGRRISHLGVGQTRAHTAIVRCIVGGTVASTTTAKDVQITIIDKMGGK